MWFVNPQAELPKRMNGCVVNAPFDPADAVLIEAPPGRAVGHWAGAPGAWSEPDAVYLVYRLRWPRPRRGGELRIARGDGERFQTIWSAKREDFGSQSIERCAILRDGKAVAPLCELRRRRR